MCLVSILQLLHGRIFVCENPYFSSVTMHLVLAEVMSTLQKLLSEKNKLSLDFANAAWHKYFCEDLYFFSVKMVFTEITSFFRNYSLRKTSLIPILQMLYDRNIHIVILDWVLAEITSILQKLFPEKDALSLNSTSTAWQKFFCKMHNFSLS